VSVMILPKLIGAAEDSEDVKMDGFGRVYLGGGAGGG